LSNVGAVVHAPEADFGGGIVGGIDGRVQGVAARGDSEDPTTISDQFGAVYFGAGVKDGGSGCFGGLDSGDFVACSGCAGVVFGRQGEADGAIAPHAAFDGSGSVDHQVEKLQEVALEAVQDGLGFGIAEADVVFEDFGTAGSEDEAGVEESGEGHALGTHLAEGGLDDALHDVAGLGSGEDAGIGISAHASGVRALVVIKDAFVVLRRAEGDEEVAVADADKADLLAFKELFDDEHGAKVLDGGGGFGLGLGDDDALSSMEAVGLDDDGQGELLYCIKSLLMRSGLNGACAGDGGAFEEVFGEDFGAFKLSGSLGGADDFEAALVELVYDSSDKRGFGADDSEVDCMSGGDFGITGDGIRGGKTGGDLSDSGIAGGGEDLLDGRGLAETPGEGVFAAAGADN
jgi:hypothetical protein